MAAKRILFYEVSEPIYENYKTLVSPIVKCTAKGLNFSGVPRLDLLFLQDNGEEIESFSFDLNFSKKNVEEKLAELFSNFSLL